jgi:cobalamin biosynthesis protein CbiG
MRAAALVLGAPGRRSARLIAETLEKEGDTLDILENTDPGGLPALVAEAFGEYEGLVFVMASGIVVRMIAPHVRSKYEDPAVVVLDDARRYAISLLSGHEGGANRLAYRVAAATGAEPVITTGTETAKTVILGIGCRRGVKREDIVSAIERGCAEAEIDIAEIRLAATVDLKRDESGLKAACRELGLPLRFFSASRINALKGNFEENEVTLKRLGIAAVAEPCALLAGREARLILPKTIYTDTTVALAREEI